MASDTHVGPIFSLGSQLGNTTAPDNNPYEGPSGSTQGFMLVDPRALSLANPAIGKFPGFILSSSIVSTNYIPAASAATPVNIAPAANAVSGVPMTLAASSAGISTNIPFYESGTSILRTSGVTLDFGFAAVGTTAGSATITGTAAVIALLYPAQWVVIAGVGNSGGTIPLLTQIQTIAPALTSFTVTALNVPLATNAAAQIGQANVLSPYSPATQAMAWTPNYVAGAGRILNPRDGVSRGIGIAGSASATGGAFLVRGWDIWGVPMSQTITAAAGVGPTYGLKAMKHIASVTPQFTDAHNYSVGTSDVFGFNVRDPLWELNDVYFNGTQLTTNTGWTPPDATTPATAATGDVRGTIQFGTRGPLGSGAGSAVAGTQRLFMQSQIEPLDQAIMKSSNTVPMFGVTQA